MRKLACAYGRQSISAERKVCAKALKCGKAWCPQARARRMVSETQGEGWHEMGLR